MEALSQWECVKASMIQRTRTLLSPGHINNSTSNTNNTSENIIMNNNNNNYYDYYYTITTTTTTSTTTATATTTAGDISSLSGSLISLIHGRRPN